ncbi:hypothetical protein UM93_00110 [Psychromicrobium lacuslunae]|uniref:Uncharacterized protein n=1 Tax=Psychromicrobium lacuslunae TaxID=1618207 RepID=A0A0D4BVL5_9MICC|nr:hypothetical protein UM93_00110 [Psychromicrobium lacuslunae]
MFESYLTVLTGYLKNRTLTEDYLAGYVDRNSHLWLSFKEDRLADPNRPYIVSGSWKWTIQATLSEAEDLVPPNVIATIPNGRVIVYGCLDSRGVTYGYPQPGVLKAYHGVLTYHPTERVWFVDTSSYTVPSAMVKKLRC